MFGNRYFGARYFGDAYFGQGGDAVPVVVAVTPSQGGIGAKEYESRVRAWWDRIERLHAERRGRERAATEAQRQLAELEAKKRQTKTIVDRRAKLEARMDKYRAETDRISAEIDALQEEISATEARIDLARAQMERRNAEIAARAAIEAQMAIAAQTARDAARRRAMLFLMMTATQ